MNACRTRHLRQTLHRAFNILACDHHEVGHFVDNHDDIGHGFEIEFFRLVDRLAGIAVEAGLYRARNRLALFLRQTDTLVEAVNIAHADLRHLAIAVFHFAHGPFERDNGLLRVRHNRRQQMRNAVIDGKLQHLGVDHDEAEFLRRHAIEQRQDHGVDRNRLARAGGARNQNVRHLGNIGNDRLAIDGLAECQRKLRLRLLKVAARQHLTQIDHFALRVRQFDTDRVAPRNDSHTRGNRAHRARNIVGKADDARGLDARCRFKLIKRDHGAGFDIDDLATHTEIFQHALKQTGILLQRILGKRGVALHELRFGQEM